VAKITFTSHLQRHVDCPAEDVLCGAGGTLGDALQAYFARHPKVRSYVLDDQGGLRRHVVVFIGDVQARGLGEVVHEGQEIWVMQALSGG
jgi:sulfur-carrier protein